jgi:TIR domain
MADRARAPTVPQLRPHGRHSFGQPWETELYRQLDRSRAVVVIYSKSWMASDWCHFEAWFARALKRPVLPQRIDDCPIDGPLVDLQFTDLVGRRGGSRGAADSRSVGGRCRSVRRVRLGREAFVAHSAMLTAKSDPTRVAGKTTDH